MFLKKIELSYDPAIPLLSTYLEKMKTLIQKDSYTSPFTAALFTIAKTWKQAKCSSTDEWIKKLWHIYAMEYYSANKKNETMPFAAIWMDQELIILREVRKRQIPYDITI